MWLDSNHVYCPLLGEVGCWAVSCSPCFLSMKAQTCTPLPKVWINMKVTRRMYVIRGFKSLSYVSSLHQAPGKQRLLTPSVLPAWLTPSAGHAAKANSPPVDAVVTIGPVTCRAIGCGAAAATTWITATDSPGSSWMPGKGRRITHVGRVSTPEHWWTCTIMKPGDRYGRPKHTFFLFLFCFRKKKRKFIWSSSSALEVKLEGEKCVCFLILTPYYIYMSVRNVCESRSGPRLTDLVVFVLVCVCRLFIGRIQMV